MSRRIPSALAIALVATLLAGVAAAASKAPVGARACVDRHGDLRLLAGSKCPKGDRLTTLGRRGPRGAPGRAATPERDYVNVASGQTPLATAKNTVKTVVDLTALPAGSWVFNGDVTVVNFGRADYFRCKIVIGKKQIGLGTAAVGTPVTKSTVRGVPSAAATVAGIGLIGAVREPKEFTALLQCWHDLKAKGLAPYLDPGAALIAHPTATIIGHTL